MQLKKEAELAWESDKSKDRDLNAMLKATNKKNAVGSTKRVEQFRKNMRRWMIGALSYATTMTCNAHR